MRIDARRCNVVATTGTYHVKKVDVRGQLRAAEQPIVVEWCAHVIVGAQLLSWRRDATRTALLLMMQWITSRLASFSSCTERCILITVVEFHSLI